MKKQILNSFIVGAALTVATAFSPVQAQPVPLAVTFNATATYNTNIAIVDGFFGYPVFGGGTNTLTKFAFSTSDLINWLNLSSSFTNDLWNYTYTKSYALSWNATQGNKNNAATGAGIFYFPVVGSYFVAYGGQVALTNPAAKLYMPLWSGPHNLNAELGVPVKIFSYPWVHGSTPVSVPSFYNTYADFWVDRAVGQGNVNNKSGAEQDQATWSMYFNNHDGFEDGIEAIVGGTNRVSFGVTGPLSLNFVEGNPAKFASSSDPRNGLRLISVTGSGTGASDGTPAFFEYLQYQAPPQLGSSATFVNCSIKLAGSGNNYNFGKGRYYPSPNNNSDKFFWPTAK